VADASDGPPLSEAWEAFIELVPLAERSGNLADAYARLLSDPDPRVRDVAAQRWCSWEAAHVAVRATDRTDPRYDDPGFRAVFARLVTHYFGHAAWLEPGRCSMVRLVYEASPGFSFIVDDAGHGGGGYAGIFTSAGRGDGSLRADGLNKPGYRRSSLRVTNAALLPRVLFISKPIAPPFHDGTKCLVRDVATHLERVRPVLLTSRGQVEMGALCAQRIELVPIYPTAGEFAPKVTDNVRAAAWVLLRSRADVWHFVFAPNPRTSAVGRGMKRLRGVPVVQTVASPPRSFAAISKLLFGDVIVVQSRWTERQVRESCESEGRKPPRIEVIPPPVPELSARPAVAVSALLRKLRVPEGAPLFVYPGDLETSSGARVTASVCRELARALPEAVVVFAYREKTPRARVVAHELEQALAGTNVRLISELPDVLELVQAATALLFPVDDLWGKVDLPIVLLEALSLGVPVVALDQGPLADLDGAIKLGSLEVEVWVERLLGLAANAEVRRAASEEGKRAVAARYAAPRVAAAYEELYLEVGRARPK
jgi:glycosyltransferase involved in cell wall biosynthesis